MSEILQRISKETQHRAVVVERSAVNADERTVEIAFSSEAPVERWFGTEVLDHAAKSVRLQRMNDGGAVLFNHNTNQHIGVVEKSRIDTDRVGRALIRFGNSPLAQEKFQDVQDGILRHISVGYQIHELTTQNKGTKNEIERATDWEPLEISFVTVPADTSVGVGRSEHQPEVPAAVREQITHEVRKELEAETTAVREELKSLSDKLVAAEARSLSAQERVIELTAAAAERNEATTASESAARTAEAERMARMKAELEQAISALETAERDLKLAERDQEHFRQMVTSAVDSLGFIRQDERLMPVRPLVETSLKALRASVADLSRRLILHGLK